MPWNLCHDIFPCTQVNTDNATGAYDYKALCTINGFWMDEYEKETFQPCPKWHDDLRKGNPGQPWIWTEDQGWFDQWGVGRRVRDSRDQLYGIARFMSRGGSWHNFCESPPAYASLSHSLTWRCISGRHGDWRQQL